jgi:hypothetical protein
MMKAHLEEEEPASVDMTPEVADEEVPVEDAEVTPVGEPKKRRRDRHLAAVRRQKKKDRTLDARCRGRNRTWSLPAEVRPVAQRLHDTEFYQQMTPPGGIVDPGRDRSLPAEGRPVVCKWHNATFYQRRMRPERIWQQLAGRRRAMRKWHDTRETSSGATGAWKSPPEGTTLRTRSSEGPKAYGRSRGDSGHARWAELDERT